MRKGFKHDQAYRDAVGDRKRTHGMSSHPLYQTWANMIARCEVPGARGYINYGGRGVGVCLEWHDPATFIGYIEETLGPRPPGQTLDRIDNDGHYEPGNLRWATRLQQRHNRRDSK